MAERRDSKNRILRPGESQRADGRYMYRYTDSNGKRHAVYSWTLTDKDFAPKGKKRGTSLRAQEKQIEFDMLNQVVPNGNNLTVLSLAEAYTSLRAGVRSSTRAGYKTVLNVLRKDPFGSRRIDKVTFAEAKAWLARLQTVDGRGYSSIHSIRGVLRPAFRMAVENDWIRKNPFDFELATVVVNDSVTREALTRKQERRFLEFVKADRHYSRYYEGIFILFKTGLRISEFCGLTIADIDFGARRIRVERQLQRTSDMRYVIQEPKTEKGIRFVPMSDEVAECFRKVITQRPAPESEPEVDGISGFLYLDKNGMPLVALHWEHYFQRIVAKFNSIYKEEIPKVTPHVCRHTFCSNQARAGMNPKVLQYVMGHSEIGVTLNTYTHLGFEEAREEMNRLSA
ncbi:site-specific integrase [Enorma phocaeensis]|uniref:site-specific integrase n=1 Tax=Enorma phocaeensis TaxID=1871019 RepID=UPI00195BB96E|nr:site-specific integrase [Enorma phocaeensis]MBM6952874.1 site-specific integrase [Enorma phocaeensis]